MKTDLVLAGVGGQGILSIAATIGMAALKNDLYIKQSEVHGMAQRGGDVQSHMRISSKPIASDLIPKGKADLILSVEPMESLRYLPFLKPDGWLVTNTCPYVNIPNYPELDEVLKQVKKRGNFITIDADDIALKAGSKRATNIAMLGAASPFIDMPFESLEEGIRQIFAKKGDKIIDLNISALRAGREFSLENK
ncbi:MAG: indolepyruvate oxidoreductase subunit beta [Bacteroidetes bacterium]|jgi:indolepyruvate ferredoxin oxidoreductase beta subunit|nr:indolepyruvate oxidoreductase subunit beta [Bacteroidota bacterium]MBT6686153.1 indolepyruvate oxidoreductase subunit beta [Bacteroidota bacterium]MBT7143864.1 indolepyruvate oxidoreductase subunit beta [Bacteroidota bacterium]MBT7491219.1 indolepyruvate oxidoreductase subunit beta [Bacteroidota bacterium]